ncbi:MAG: topoisomerase DNA-binding C4 zinc finger domain-containing protein [Muribaculaceae bacterium]|nr:topoisomerase DNA-binding C4 zinc finger domain-containing protein [Roseburia sp.]MCM1431975.1 topoisomerase DNA-binding C4 zinc finger domain-containing protein [Muribaculaceae bacterium]MCM1493605.1 topoisomerase DNA-binding C4 zinc finger domain-containing protein [Muribaculaceae bacterium]
MAQRAVCLCDGKYIGIETIYTVINGRQVNIPEKLEALRAKSQSNELFCPCGCGANLILVAGDKNLRKQHFRLKSGTYENECHVVTEGKISVDSKIVLKCWLDDKLRTNDVETRIPVNLVGDTDRKYEFSFLSRAKKIAVSYCYERVNLSDEKFEILGANSDEMQIIYIVDVKNGGSNGQYPEALMKVQDKQGYCLFLAVEEASYDQAMLYAAFYAQDIDDLWKEVTFASDYLTDYLISADGQIVYEGKLLSVLLEESKNSFAQEIQEEKIRRKEEKKRCAEEQKHMQQEAMHRRLGLQRREQEAEEVRVDSGKEEVECRADRQHCDEDFQRSMAEKFSQQRTPIKDAAGNRWIKCEYCGRVAKESEFTSYGGMNHVNLGRCKNCSSKKAAERASIVTTPEIGIKPELVKYDAAICPECGGKLCEKSGRYGRFIGCSNYPKCRYTRETNKKRM